MKTTIFKLGLPTFIQAALFFMVTSLILTQVTAEPSRSSKPVQHAPLDKAMIEPISYSWVTQYPLISHALGGIDGYIGTNSWEALQHAYQSGHRIFETDLSVTSDGYLVLRHDWEAGTYPILGQLPPKVIAPMTLKQFESLPIQEHYSPVTFKQLAAFMSVHPDMQLITDTKEPDAKKAADLFKLVVKETTEIDSDVLRRIIPQLYQEDNYIAVSSVYPFKDYIYTLYMNTDSESRIIDFVQAKGIRVVVMDENRYSPEFVQALLKKGIYTYINTINDVNQIKAFIQAGAQGVMTDFFAPGDL